MCPESYRKKPETQNLKPYMDDKKDKISSKFNDFIEKLKEIVDEKSELDNDFIIKLDFLKILQEEGNSIATVIDDLNKDTNFIQALNQIISTNNHAVEYKAEHVLLEDVIKIYAQITKDNQETNVKAQFALAYFFEKLQGNDLATSLSLSRINQLVKSEKFTENIETVRKASFFNLPEPYKDEFLMPSILVRLEHRDAKTIATFLYRVASIFAKADDTVSDFEKETLQKISNKVFKPKVKSANIKENEVPEDDSLEKVMKELNELVGLRDIKIAVEELTNFLKVQKIRETEGLKTAKNALHSVFMGPPGTGKTTIARLLGRIFKHLGYLQKGHLVETDRAGLVAGYVGQTALKVDEVVQKALDGVLFIDEAYSLSQADNERDFGNEAVEALLKRMEDYRESLVVIVAGYPDEMQDFIQSNPGLQSRFNRYYKFEHYQPIELMEIFKIFAQKADFKLSADAEEKLMEIFDRLYEKRNKSFGNARVARNLFEKITERQATRIVNIPKIDKEILMTIEEPDVPEINKTVEDILVFKEDEITNEKTE